MQILSKSSASEWITALASTLLAVAILGVVVSAQSGQELPDRLARLDAETRLQFRLALSHDAKQHESRTRQLDAAWSVWRQSSQTADDEHLLASWLRDSMARSMPGSTRPLAPIPSFSKSQPQVARRPEPSHRPAVLDARPGPPPVAAPRVKDRANPTPPGPQQPNSQDPETHVAPTLASTDAASEKPSPVSETDFVSAGESDVATQLPLLPPPAGALEPNQTATGPSEITSVVNEAASESPEVSSSTPDHRVEYVASREMVEAPHHDHASPELSSARPAEEASVPVAIDLMELSDRVDHYHRRLDQMERSWEIRPPTKIDDLSRAVGELERLSGDREFAQLYYDSLTEHERHFVTSPRPLIDALVILRRQLAEAAEDADGDFLRSVDSDRTNALADLARRLDRLAGD